MERTSALGNAPLLSRKAPLPSTNAPPPSVNAPPPSVNAPLLSVNAPLLSVNAPLLSVNALLLSTGSHQLVVTLLCVGGNAPVRWLECTYALVRNDSILARKAPVPSF